jgi:bifunctional UDP-N-acetylglucosamine pyrophosphorylase/glucosamine-1-phosphate N-acetyltransferase
LIDLILLADSFWGMLMKTEVIILAAGKGTRMVSSLPKPLHPLMGKPIIHYVLSSVQPLSEKLPVLVIGHGGDIIQEELAGKARFVVQEELLGTGHAVQQAESILDKGSDLVLVVYGDMPLVKPATLEKLIETQKSQSGAMTLLTVTEEDPRGFGRIIRNESGQIKAIIEEADATQEQLEITELNAGMYCFKTDWLLENLKNLELSSKGEYYLTDLVGLAVEGGHEVSSVEVQDSWELLGINNRVHLAEAHLILQEQINLGWMLSGVSIIDPGSTYIDPDVKIGQDTMILPNTYIQGETVIGEGCVIGPGTRVYKSQIGNQCEIEFSVVEESLLEDRVDIGPYSHLRRGAHLAADVHVGNFGEIKDSYLGEGSKMGHFSYVGDAQIGKDVNIGAGTITCNYDGKNKHKTIIHDGVFIGSDSMLVAPLEIGENATTGAGSVVTKDVPPNAVVVGVPARQTGKKAKGD